MASSPLRCAHRPVVRAALRHPDLPVAQLDGPARELRLLVDHREDLVNERTPSVNRLRWRLDELDPTWDPAALPLTCSRNMDAVAARLVPSEITADVRDLTTRERALEREIITRIQALAPRLLALVGRRDHRRQDRRDPPVQSKDAFARHDGTAPLPVWSGNQDRHRLARTGDRQLNAAIHRIAITRPAATPVPSPTSSTAPRWATRGPKAAAPSCGNSQTPSTEPSSPSPTATAVDLADAA